MENIALVYLEMEFMFFWWIRAYYIVCWINIENTLSFMQLLGLLSLSIPWTLFWILDYGLIFLLYVKENKEKQYFYWSQPWLWYLTWFSFPKFCNCFQAFWPISVFFCETFYLIWRPPVSSNFRIHSIAYSINGKGNCQMNGNWVMVSFFPLMIFFFCVRLRSG